MANLSDVMTDYLDVRELITMVKRRPGLWDVTCPDYWDRSTRRQLWEEIVELLMDGEDATAAEKKEFGNIIQKRWKSLSGSYTREYQRLSKLKPKDSCFKSPYYYFNHLSFLEPTMNKSTAVSTESENPVAIDVEDAAYLHRGAPGWGRKRFQEDNIKTFKKIKEDNEEGQEKHFLLSLLDPLKKIPQHLRLSVRMELLQVLQRAQNNMTTQYAQVPLLFYHYPYHLSVIHPSEEAAQPPLLHQPTIDEADTKPSTQRFVVMQKLSPPTTPSSLNSASDTELELFQASV